MDAFKRALFETDDLSTDDNKLIHPLATWDYTRWIVLSSSGFFIPASYALNCKWYGQSFLLFATGVFSINYWRRATYSWRRNMDVLVAKIDLVFFAANGFYHVRSIYLVSSGSLTMMAAIYFYYASCRARETGQERDGANWHKYHMAWHAFLIISLFIAMCGMKCCTLPTDDTFTCENPKD